MHPEAVDGGIAAGRCTTHGLDPDGHVTPLDAQHPVQDRRRKMRAIPVVNKDQLGLGEREVDMQVNESPQQSSGRVRRTLDRQTTGEKSLTHVDEQFCQNRFLARKVPIHRRATDARRPPDVLEPDAQVPIPRHQLACREQ